MSKGTSSWTSQTGPDRQTIYRSRRLHSAARAHHRIEYQNQTLSWHGGRGLGESTGGASADQTIQDSDRCDVKEKKVEDCKTWNVGDEESEH